MANRIRMLGHWRISPSTTQNRREMVRELGTRWSRPSFSPYQPLELLGLLYSILSVQDIGRIVMIVGIILAIGGALLWKFPGWFGWIGRLPGDISVQKGNFSFYFPVVTCILVSVILTILSWLFRR
jgi:Protein of unknown function (DUF2905)